MNKSKALAWFPLVCVLATVVAFIGPGPATAAVTRPAAPSAYAAFQGRLYSVAAISADDVWGAGLGPSGALITHWDGRAWSQTLPGPGYLLGVADSSARDVWAVSSTTSR
jgi:hypothetical protein